MVIRMDIANFVVHKVLVDNGCLVDVIFMDVLKKMDLEVTHINPTHSTGRFSRVRDKPLGYGGLAYFVGKRSHSRREVG